MRIAFLLLIAAVSVTTAGAQAALRREPVRVFLDCEFCDFEYLRVETPWVEFVRDRTAGDVHLLLTRIETGGGGQQYQLAVLPVDGSRRDTLIFQTEPSATEDTRRREITRNVQLALVPYALRTEAGRNLRLMPSRASEAPEDRPGPSRDPWHSWVFEVSGGASVRNEERQSNASFDGGLDGRRVTSLLKLGFEASADYDRSRFELDDDSAGALVSTAESYDGGLVAVRSIGRKWGLGAEASVASSTFRNTRFALRAAPAIEYSLWPYEEATRRQLVFQYSVGISSFAYREETIFDKLEETRPNHTFVISYDVRQPWGSADASLEAAAYLDDRQQNRLELDAEWNLRLFRGMELEFGGSVERVRDQLSIPKRDATPEEILLERRALATDYRYDMRVGFSYTFGSIFSAVVNPRFGSGPGDILR
jgi:hypothetical protein